MADYIEQLRGRLLKLGCPITHVQRLVREVADHREDLKQAGLAQGLAEADAEARANTLLGDPLFLAEQMMKNIRRSSWWGRHRVVTFVVLPLLAFPVLWFLIIFGLLVVFALNCGLNLEKRIAAAHNPIIFHRMLLGFHLMDFLAIALVTLLFCWLARRAEVKPKWLLISSVICSLLAVVCWPKLEPAAGDGMFNITWGGNVGTTPAIMLWFGGALPLMVAGATYFFQRRAARRFQQKVTR